LREAAVVWAVVVVGVEVVVEVASEAGVADVDVAGEGRSPAFLEDGAWRRSTWPLVWGRPERMWVIRPPGRAMVWWKCSARNSLPSSTSARSSRQPAAASCLAMRRASCEVWLAVGLACGQTTRSAQA